MIDVLGILVLLLLMLRLFSERLVMYLKILIRVVTTIQIMDLDIRLAVGKGGRKRRSVNLSGGGYICVAKY